MFSFIKMVHAITWQDSIFGEEKNIPFTTYARGGFYDEKP